MRLQSERSPPSNKATERECIAWTKRRWNDALPACPHSDGALDPAAPLFIGQGRRLDEGHPFHPVLDARQRAEVLFIRPAEVARHDRLSKVLIEIGKGEQISLGMAGAHPRHRFCFGR